MTEGSVEKVLTVGDLEGILQQYLAPLVGRIDVLQGKIDDLQRELRKQDEVAPSEAYVIVLDKDSPSGLSWDRGGDLGKKHLDAGHPIGGVLRDVVITPSLGSEQYGDLLVVTAHLVSGEKLFAVKFLVYVDVIGSTANLSGFALREGGTSVGANNAIVGLKYARPGQYLSVFADRKKGSKGYFVGFDWKKADGSNLFVIGKGAGKGVGSNYSGTLADLTDLLKIWPNAYQSDLGANNPEPEVKSTPIAVLTGKVAKAFTDAAGGNPDGWKQLQPESFEHPLGVYFPTIGDMVQYYESINTEAGRDRILGSFIAALKTQYEKF
jgi:hypothetical protein